MWLPYQFQGQKVKVTRPINAHTHRVPYLLNGKAYELKLGVRVEDDDPHQSQAPLPPRSKIKVTRSPWSLWAVLAKCCTCVIRGRRGHTMSAELDGHTSCLVSVVRLKMHCWLCCSFICHICTPLQKKNIASGKVNEFERKFQRHSRENADSVDLS